MDRRIPRIEALNVSAGYDRRPVVRGVSFEIRPGEMVGLIGPNGAGKSTLLRALSASIRPTGGTVRLDGVDLGTMRPRDVALKLAFVPQSEPAVFDFLVKEIVLMGRHPHLRGLGGETEADFDAAARAMAATDLLELADRPVTGLSGGEHRRVLIARALAQQTPTLLLDEPVAHLDVTHQVDILALARRMADRDSVAVLAAMHELNLAAEFCDRLILLAEGKLLADGPPETVMTTDLLERAYGATLEVSVNPASGKPMVLPFHAPETAEQPGPAVHVICGGATGAAVLSHLARRGYRVTAGVLNLLDTDQRTAEALNVEYVAEAPFSPIGESAAAKGLELARRAEAVILTDVPIGSGNLPNLWMALDLCRDGKPVIAIQPSPFAARDFTDEGEATELWEMLMTAGAIVVEDSRAAVDAVARMTAENASAH